MTAIAFATTDIPIEITTSPKNSKVTKKPLVSPIRRQVIVFAIDLFLFSPTIFTLPQWT